MKKTCVCVCPGQCVILCVCVWGRGQCVCMWGGTECECVCVCSSSLCHWPVDLQQTAGVEAFLV